MADLLARIDHAVRLHDLLSQWGEPPLDGPLEVCVDCGAGHDQERAVCVACSRPPVRVAWWRRWLSRLGRP